MKTPRFSNKVFHALRRYFTAVLICTGLLGGFTVIAFVPALGWFPMLLLGLLYGAFATGSLFMLRSYIRRQITDPLIMIADTARHVSSGMSSARINAEEINLCEFREAAEAVNNLADKAARDIAELKKLERVRSQFLGNVSHELRTPIFSIQGYLETLLDGAIDDENVRRRFVERAHANAIRLNVLLSDLIDISKIESGEMRMSYRYFNLAELIRDTCNALEFQANQYNVTISSNVNGKELTVYGDKERLGQALTNLVENAIKYNQSGGRVDILVDLRPQDVMIKIQDTGIGIAPEHQERIFERFYRVDKDRSRAVGGSGLGLAIVKHILEAHQSTLMLESEPGKGTCISFQLKR
jgi:two-component system phosphate regulon sensor histidine kinase PhoR